MQNCNLCGSPFKNVPAGVSKLGKPYEAFVACTKFGCKGKPGGIALTAPQYVNPNVAAPSNQPVSNQSNDIRANVALKMVSEILAAKIIDIQDWKMWTDEFYCYLPPSDKPQTNEITTITDNGELENIPF